MLRVTMIDEATTGMETRLRQSNMPWKLDAEGYIGLPPGPGLGVDVDEKKLEEEAKKPQT